MFCQACGANNVDAARFCNMCGTRIAAPGTPGGLVAAGAPATAALDGSAPRADLVGQASAVAAPAGPAAAAPASVWGLEDAAGTLSGGRPSSAHADALPQPMGHLPSGGHTASISLDGIGVRSAGRTWAMVGVGAGVLLGVGLTAAFFLNRAPDAPPLPPVEAPVPAGAPMEIGTPLPVGEEPPAGPVEGSSGAAAPSGEPRPGVRVDATTAGAARGGGEPGPFAAAGAPVGAAGGAGASGTGAAADPVGAGGRLGGGSPAEPPGGVAAEPPGGGGGSVGEASGEAGAGGAAGSAPPSELPEERDIELEMYGARVRYVIRRYYSARAQTCFDRATRNNPNVRGTVVVAFTIAPDGQVSRTSVGRNTTGDEGLGTCLAMQVRSWRLPAPGEEMDFEMPFSR